MRKETFLPVVAAVFLLGITIIGCASSVILPAEPLMADKTTAKVYFIMPGSGVTLTGGGGLTIGTKFYIWDSDTFLSAIGGKEFVALNLKAGTHYLMASCGNWYIVQAELEAGKTYHLELITLPGFSSPNVRIKYLEPNDPELEGYLKKSKEIFPNGKVYESTTKEAKKQLNAALEGSQEIDRVPPRVGFLQKKN